MGRQRLAQAPEAARNGWAAIEGPGNQTPERIPEHLVCETSDVKHRRPHPRARAKRLEEEAEPIEHALLFGTLLGAALASVPLLILFALPSNVFSAEAWQEAPVAAAGPILLWVAVALLVGAVLLAVLRNLWSHYLLRRAARQR